MLFFFITDHACKSSIGPPENTLDPLGGRGPRLRTPGLLQWLKSVTSAAGMLPVVYDQGHNIVVLVISSLCQVLLKNF